jgi:hypothetical protein
MRAHRCILALTESPERAGQSIPEVPNHQMCRSGAGRRAGWHAAQVQPIHAQTFRAPAWQRRLWIVMAIVLPLGLMLSTTTHGNAFVTAIAIIAASVFAYIPLRAALSSVTVSTNGLGIVNWPRRHRVPWNHVVGIGRGRFVDSRVIKLRDGHRLPVTALSYRYPRSWMTEPINEIEARAEAGPAFA